MKTRFTKALLALGISGAAIGAGFGASSALAGASTTGTTSPSSPSTTAPPSTHNCPHMGGSSGSGTDSAMGYVTE